METPLQQQRQYSVPTVQCALFTVQFTILQFLACRAMETLLEQQRRYHEERERLMDGMVQVLITLMEGNETLY